MGEREPLSLNYNNNTFDYVCLYLLTMSTTVNILACTMYMYKIMLYVVQISISTQKVSVN